MPTYKALSRCYVGTRRRPGDVFEYSKEFKVLPKYLERVDLTPQQKAALTRKAKAKAKQAKDDAEMIQQVTHSAEGGIETL